MRAIKSKNMKPELIVRSVAHRLGYRFRLHRKDLPGKPDLVFPRLGCVIFVHGCFWHQHTKSTCADGRLPKSRQDYWIPKLARNVERDKRNTLSLRRRGWRVMKIWECETGNEGKILSRIETFLSRL